MEEELVKFFNRGDEFELVIYVSKTRFPVVRQVSDFNFQGFDLEVMRFLNQK